MSKYNLELTRLDSTLNSPEGLVDIEHSLNRAQEIIKDLDNRVTSIDTSSDTVCFKKLFTGTGWTTITSTNTKYLGFNNLSKNKNYRVTYKLYGVADPYNSDSELYGSATP